MGTSINRINNDKVKVDIKLQLPYNNTMVTRFELCSFVETDIFHLRPEMTKSILFPCVKCTLYFDG